MLCIDRGLSEKIKVQSFVFTIFVVAAHAGAYSEHLATRIFPSFLVMAAVPFFFFISGLLMFRNYVQSGAWWRKVVLTRLKTLYIPFLLWNVIYFAMKMAVGKVGNAGLGGQVICALEAISGFNPMCATPCGPFWYIRILLLFSLFALPIGWLLSGRTSWLYVGLLWLAYVICPERQFLQTGMKMSSITWFCSGAFIALHYDELNALRRRHTSFRGGSVRVLMLILFLVFYALHIVNPSWRIALHGCVMLGVALIWISYPQTVNIGGRCREVLGLSFFVFAVHPLIITLLSRILHVPSCVARYYVVWAVALGTSIVFGWLLRRFMGRAYGLLCGGRR